MTDERNNQERLPEAEKQEEKRVKKDPLDFISPTQAVDLPSKGRFYPKDSPMHLKDTVEISSMTANEEEILNNRSLIKNGNAIEKVLDSIMDEGGISHSDLFIGDKSAILIAARIDAYSSKYEVNMQCPMCSAHNQISYDLTEESRVNEGGVEALSDEKQEKYSVEHLDEDRFFMVLPRSGVEAEFRFLRGSDEEEINKKRRNYEKRNLQFSNNVEQMKRFIMALQGNRDKNKIAKFTKRMPAEDSRALRNVYSQVTPSKDLMTEVTCSRCDFFEEREVPIRGTFFWPDR